MDIDNMEAYLVSIISNVGTARSCYIEAIQEAKKGNFDQCKELIKEGEKYFAVGHDAHLHLISREASGENRLVSLIMVHAEDQLMSAEGFHIIAEELIFLYEKCNVKVL